MHAPLVPPGEARAAMPSRPTWTSGLCRGDLEAEGCPAADLVPLGLESGDIPNSQITSAVGGACAVTDIRLNSGAAWCSGTNVAGDWAQVDLGAVVSVAAIGTQARKGGSQYVAQFTVSSSTDGSTWTSVTDGSGGTTFTGNSENCRYDECVAYSSFYPTASARYIRIYAMVGVGYMSMRAELYSCSLTVSSLPALSASFALSDLTCTQLQQTCPTANLVPLGLESGDIPNSQITSAVGGACAVTDIRLNSGAAWCSGTNVAGDWAQVDLGAIVNVGVIGTQARKGGSQYVAQFTVSSSTDGSTWTSVTDGSGSTTFTGNSQNCRYNGCIAYNVFSPSVSARYIRIYAMVGVGYMSMRAELYSCTGTESVCTGTYTADLCGFSDAADHAADVSSTCVTVTFPSTVSTADVTATKTVRACSDIPLASITHVNDAAYRSTVWDSRFESSNTLTGSNRWETSAYTCPSPNYVCTPPQWVAWDFQQARGLCSVCIESTNANTWELQGSSSLSGSWTTVETYTKISGTNNWPSDIVSSTKAHYSTGASVTCTRFPVSSNAKWRYWRIYITVGGGNHYVYVGKVFFDEDTGVANEVTLSLPVSSMTCSTALAQYCPTANLVPLGLESGDIPNSQITSAVGGACAVTDIRLNSGAAWCSGTNVAGDWAQVDLGAIVNVGVIGTQARKGGSQYVAQFTVSSSTDGSTWTSGGAVEVRLCIARLLLRGGVYRCAVYSMG
ncbi:hypothetical protein CYMTET_21743 [Cymbomonas tetramitiformis]|uniref:F5/8 type C domain-containing protein n=1 Tax=Cymbomonas tetramitiformis TaxID=36881 RepID=A0AAE0G1E8_9CHLO|nr:hypothetical protein CYMTET_21743 [Cymbomonas tetramitiformis]